MKRACFAGPHSVCTPHSNEQLKLNIKCHNLCGNLSEVKKKSICLSSHQKNYHAKEASRVFAWTTLNTYRMLPGWGRVIYQKSLYTEESELYPISWSLWPLFTALCSKGEIATPTNCLWICSSRCTSWSTEQRVSQGSELLMAKILANFKAAVGLSLVLAEANTGSSHPYSQGGREGQLGCGSCESLVGSWDTCGARLALAPVCGRKGKRQWDVFLESSHSPLSQSQGEQHF